MAGKKEPDQGKKKQPSAFKKTAKNILFAFIAMAVYVAAMLLIYYFSKGHMPGTKFVVFIVLILGAVGAVPIAFNMKWFGSLFLLSGIGGSIADVAVQKASDGYVSTTTGKWYIICLIAGAVIGAVCEGVRISIKRVRAQKQQQKQLEEAQKVVDANSAAQSKNQSQGTSENK
ncbi:MAG: hypothetical protein ACOX6J_02040 [Oscillospiraceae bacterium]